MVSRMRSHAGSRAQRRPESSQSCEKESRPSLRSGACVDSIYVGSLFPVVVIRLFRSGDDLLAGGGAALGTLESHDRAPKVLLGQLRFRDLIELVAGGSELVAVRQDLPPNRMARHDYLELLELVVVQRPRRQRGRGVAAA